MRKAVARVCRFQVGKNGTGFGQERTKGFTRSVFERAVDCAPVGLCMVAAWAVVGCGKVISSERPRSVEVSARPVDGGETSKLNTAFANAQRNTGEETGGGSSADPETDKNEETADKLTGVGGSQGNEPNVGNNLGVGADQGRQVADDSSTAGGAVVLMDGSDPSTGSAAAAGAEMGNSSMNSLGQSVTTTTTTINNTTTTVVTPVNHCDYDWGQVATERRWSASGSTEIIAAYVVALNRPPEPDGLHWWVSQHGTAVASGAMTRGQLLGYFLGRGEGLAFSTQGGVFSSAKLSPHVYDSAFNRSHTLNGDTGYQILGNALRAEVADGTPADQITEAKWTAVGGIVAQWVAGAAGSDSVARDARITVARYFVEQTVGHSCPYDMDLSLQALEATTSASGTAAGFSIIDDGIKALQAGSR